MNLSDLSDRKLLVAVTMAREEYNKNLPQLVDEKGQPVDNPDVIVTNEDYFDFRCMNMLRNLAQQMGTDLDEIDYKINVLQTKRAEIVDKYK